MGKEYDSSRYFFSASRCRAQAPSSPFVRGDPSSLGNPQRGQNNAPRPPRPRRFSPEKCQRASSTNSAAATGAADATGGNAPDGRRDGSAPGAGVQGAPEQLPVALVAAAAGVCVSGTTTAAAAVAASAAASAGRRRRVQRPCGRIVRPARRETGGQHAGAVLLQGFMGQLMMGNMEGCKQEQ
jgi:hypothetical protein